MVAQNSEKCVGNCIAYSGDASVSTGWEDGFIRNYSVEDGTKRWEIPNAHKGPVTAIADSFTLGIVVSGGADGFLRVWLSNKRELLCNFRDHQGSVTQVLLDVISPALIHSCGLDRAIHTYDLKRERRTVTQQVHEGTFRDMSQRKDHEQELVTANSLGELMFWDCDETAPVGRHKQAAPLTSVAVSPTGEFVATSAEDCSITIWHVGTLQLVSEGTAHSKPVTRLAWSPDEKQVISVDPGCCICVWNFYGLVGNLSQ